MAKRKTKKVEKATKITNDELNKVQSIINNINRAQLEIGSFETKKHNMLHHVGILQDEYSKLYSTDTAIFLLKSFQGSTSLFFLI